MQKVQIDYQPIFDYIEANNAVLEESILDKVRAEFNPKFDRIFGLFDGMTARLSKYDDETPIANLRTGSLEKWAKPVGKKVGIPFKPAL